MNAVALGPLVFDAGRISAIAGIFIYVLLAELVFRLGNRKSDTKASGNWITAGLFAWLVGARLGFVIQHFDQFATHPLDVFKLWQGGFLPLAGWIAGAAVLALALLQRSGAMLALGVGGVAALLIQFAAPALFPASQMRMPVAQLLTMDDQPRQIAGGGKPVVLNLWATWCPPCRREMPMMVDLAQNTPEIEFIFANQGDTAELINRFLTDENLPRDGMLRDPQQNLMEKTGAIGLPSTLVFDGQGRLVASQTGEISRAALSAMIKKAIGEQE